MLRSYLCDYSDVYIALKGIITIIGTNNANRGNKKLTFKNNAPFRSCILKIINTFIDKTEDLDIFMSMYNMLEYSDNYSIASGYLWKYYKDEVNEHANENSVADNYKINNSKTTVINSVESMAKIIDVENNNADSNNIIFSIKETNLYVPVVTLSLKDNQKL